MSPAYRPPYPIRLRKLVFPCTFISWVSIYNCVYNKQQQIPPMLSAKEQTAQDFYCECEHIGFQADVNDDECHSSSDLSDSESQQPFRFFDLRRTRSSFSNCALPPPSMFVRHSAQPIPGSERVSTILKQNVEYRRRYHRMIGQEIMEAEHI